MDLGSAFFAKNAFHECFFSVCVCLAVVGKAMCQAQLQVIIFLSGGIVVPEMIAENEMVFPKVAVNGDHV